jgi:hypothetical protein
MGINIKILPAINKVNSFDSGVQAISAINETNLSSIGSALS